MKLYKTYFDKKDTPYSQLFQQNKKYHIVWKRIPYGVFLGHKVVKVKLLGLFNIKTKNDNIKMINDLEKEK